MTKNADFTVLPWLTLGFINRYTASRRIYTTPIIIGLEIIKFCRLKSSTIKHIDDCFKTSCLILKFGLDLLV